MIISVDILYTFVANFVTVIIGTVIIVIGSIFSHTKHYI